MARRKKLAPLAVYLNGRRIGRLRRETSGAIDFQYDEAWLQWEHTQPVSLSLPLREERYIGAPVATVFDNLLPDHEDIRARIAAKVGADGIDPFSLLTALGRDCVGALQFLPEDAAAPIAGAIEGEPVTDDEIARILSQLAASPLGLDENDDFRISLAGAQEKTAFLRHEGQWLKPHGSTPTTHIFKPQIGQIQGGIDLSNSVENEYFCLKLIKALGLPTANVEIANFGKKAVLIVERFDRFYAKDGRLLRRAQEDFCQALSVPWTRKYENHGGPGILDCMDLLGASDEVTLDRQAFFKTMIIFWLLGATDGHAKNFSIFLYPGNGFRLTPLYDVLSVQPTLDAKQIRQNQMKLSMAVGDNRHYGVKDITPRHFVQTGERAGLSPATVRGIFAELVVDASGALSATMAALPMDFPKSVSDSITAALRERLSMIERS